jgi:single-stranded-DNA-specific exonuclease
VAPPPRPWELQACDEAAAAALSGSAGVGLVTARLLCQRGITTADAAARFLRPSLDHLHDPFRLTGMDRAVGRVLAAIERRERVAIHGDYDVDGITSTVILERTIQAMGGDVTHFIPERLRDGYGLQPAAVERLAADGVGLIISVDCGIRSIDAARRAAELGVDLVITDHHEPDHELPHAVAVLNPKQPGCAYPDKHLAGVGVALKLVQALCSRTGREKWLPAFVKIAALGTLADVVPLVGENRVIAKIGLDLLSRGPHKVGLRALLDAAGLSGRPIDSYSVGYILAPRINAAGRMATPDIAARLLLATDEALAPEARALAEQLNAENLRRQAQELEILAEARRAIENDPDIGAHSVLVVAGEGWHRGVIGIVASKLVDQFHRPAVVVSLEDGIGHGSCRSIGSFDMLGAIEACGAHLIRFGGHRMAAGLTLDAAELRAFRAALQAHGDDRLGPDDLRPRLRVDARLEFDEIKGTLVEEVQALEPFGLANARPVFCAGPVEIVDGPRRIKDRHLKMSVRQKGRIFRAIAWRSADREPFFAEHRGALDLAFSLTQNTFNGETYTELTLADARAPEPGGAGKL